MSINSTYIGPFGALGRVVVEKCSKTQKNPLAMDRVIRLSLIGENILHYGLLDPKILYEDPIKGRLRYP